MCLLQPNCKSYQFTSGSSSGRLVTAQYNVILILFCYYRAYEDLRVKHEPLQLITPQFETPLPPLQPAVSLFYY